MPVPRCSMQLLLGAHGGSTCALVPPLRGGTGTAPLRGSARGTRHPRRDPQASQRIVGLLRDEGIPSATIGSVTSACAGRDLDLTLKRLRDGTSSQNKRPTQAGGTGFQPVEHGRGTRATLFGPADRDGFGGRPRVA